MKVLLIRQQLDLCSLPCWQAARYRSRTKPWNCSEDFPANLNWQSSLSSAQLAQASLPWRTSSSNSQKANKDSPCAKLRRVTNHQMRRKSHAHKES